MGTAFININYKAPDVDTYRGVGVKIDEQTTIFDTGFMPQDFFDATKFATENAVRYICLSSVDDFCVDGEIEDLKAFSTNPTELEITIVALRKLIQVARIAVNGGLVSEQIINSVFKNGFTIFPEHNDTMNEFGWLITKGGE